MIWAIFPKEFFFSEKMDLCSLVPNDFFLGSRELSKLGSGVFSEVFLVETRNGRRFAVKEQYYETHQPFRVETQPGVFEEMDVVKKGISQASLLEADTLVRLRGVPQIIYLEGVCIHTGLDQLSLILEPMMGSLLDLFQMGPITRRRFFPKLMSDLVTAAAVLQTLNINHYDVKPHNVLFNTDGTNFEFKLTDFGLTRGVFPGVVVQKEIVTGIYRSPELIYNRPRKDIPEFKIDVWSIGITLLEFLINGSAINSSEDIRLMGNPGAIRNGTITGRYPISVDLTGIPENFQEAFRSMLSLNPRDRPTPLQLASQLGITTLPTVITPEEQGRKSDSYVKLLINGATEKDTVAAILISLEILTRYLGMNRIMNKSYLAAIYRLGSVYIDDDPIRIEHASEKFEVSVSSVQDAEVDLLTAIGFRVYNANLTGRMIELDQKFAGRSSEILRVLKTLPVESFALPIWEWFK
jgi:serine/threonine protein kinase